MPHPAKTRASSPTRAAAAMRTDMSVPSSLIDAEGDADGSAIWVVRVLVCAVMTCRMTTGQPSAATNGNLRQHGPFDRVGVDSERIDQSPPDAGRALDGIDDRHVIGVGDALEAVNLMNH